MRVTPLVSVLLVLTATGCRTSPVARAPAPRAEAQPAPLPMAAALGTEGAYFLDWKLVAEGVDARVIQAPRVLVRPSDLATASVGDETSFIQTFDAEVTEGALIADPVIGTLAEGVEIESLVMPTATPDGHARLAFHVLRTKLNTPIPEREVRLVAESAPGRIQLPRIDVSDLVGATRVPLDREIDLGVLPARGREPACRVRVTVHEVGDVRAPAPKPLPSEEPEPSTEPEAAGPESRPDALGWDPLRVPDLAAMAAALSDAPGAGTHPRLRIVRAPEHRAAAPVVVATLDLPPSPVVGTRRAELLERAYLQDYDAVDKESKEPSKGAPRVYVPVVATLVTGARAEVVLGASGPELSVSWRHTRDTQPFTTELPNGPRVVIDLPETQVLTGTFPLGASRLVPLGKVLVGNEVQRVYLSLTYE